MDEELKKVKINQSDIKYDEEGKRSGRLAVFMYRGEYDPKAVLDESVRRYTENSGYHQFISYELDNPWIRVVIQDVNAMFQKNFDPINDKIDVKIRR